MPSPLRKTWQDCKKQMGPGADKNFKKDLGPTLDKAQDAYDAVLATSNNKFKVEGFSDSTPDLVKLRSKLATALPLHEKVHTVATGYKSLVEKMDKKSPGVTTALKTLTDIINHFHQQDTLMRQHIPSEDQSKKFKEAFMKATLKQI
jgi:hypothetical protein